MVYKRVKGWTLGRSLLVLNFVKYSLPPKGGAIFWEIVIVYKWYMYNWWECFDKWCLFVCIGHACSLSHVVLLDQPYASEIYDALHQRVSMKLILTSLKQFHCLLNLLNCNFLSNFSKKPLGNQNSAESYDLTTLTAYLWKRQHGCLTYIMF